MKTTYPGFLAFILFVFAILVLTGCPWTGYGYKYPHGKLPGEPVNLEDFNTEYDDYNMSAPDLGELIPCCYSTNRHSQGEDFDIKYEPMNVNWSKDEGVLTVHNYTTNRVSRSEEFGVVRNAVDRINSAGDELGPNLVYSRYFEFSDADFVLLYASDLDGDFDIGYTYNDGTTAFAEGAPVAFLNSPYDDLYPTFDSGFSRIYFCSDRDDGVFNIYHTEVSYVDDRMVGLLSDTTEHEVILDPVLSSAYDDKCPTIYGNTLVFTSNRPGGSGGYDLYFSNYVNGAWSVPVNFGPEINTAADEYRPVHFDPGVDMDRNMMIFSSDRSGGEGGFDLYFVGILKDL